MVPPLTVTRQDCDRAFSILNTVLDELDNPAK